MLNRKIRFSFIVFLGFLFLGVGPKVYAEFQLVGVHPTAQLNWYGAGETCLFEDGIADGRSIGALQAFKGGIYAGRTVIRTPIIRKGFM